MTTCAMLDILSNALWYIRCRDPACDSINDPVQSDCQADSVGKRIRHGAPCGGKTFRKLMAT